MLKKGDQEGDNIREKGERLSADDSTIKSNGSSEQCSVYYDEGAKHLFREDRNCRRKRDQEGDKGERENRLSTDDLTIKAYGSGKQCSVYYVDWVKHISRQDRNC